ncbi:MAG: transposase zinc-binding domain-containing protein [Pirellulaceae bacterium]|nr:transposase zinc-binding domain-containing protein [Pirellulaceae bacterium]
MGNIFRAYGPAYLKKYADQMPEDQIKAMSSIMRCRTPEAGSAVYQCQDCGKYHHVPGSCGNRHCPICRGVKAKIWLRKQLDQLLPRVYFMLTFTVPAEFRSFMRSHPRECYRAIFQAAKATLFKLAKDPKYIGSSKLGIPGVLHTRGRDLNYHPHVHFIVPGHRYRAQGGDSLPHNCWRSRSEHS